MAKRNDTRAIVESFVGELETLMREHVNRQLAAAFDQIRRSLEGSGDAAPPDDVTTTARPPRHCRKCGETGHTGRTCGKTREAAPPATNGTAKESRADRFARIEAQAKAREGRS